jgi:hypothetical protein
MLPVTARVGLLPQDTRLNDDHRQSAEQERVLRAVNKGKVTAILDPARGAACDGHVNGPAKTIDVFWAGAARLPPNRSSAWFGRGSSTPE